MKTSSKYVVINFFIITTGAFLIPRDKNKLPMVNKII